MATVVSFVKILLLCTTAWSAPRPEVIDLGYGLDGNTQFWPGTQRFNITLEMRQRNENGIPWLASNTFETAEHIGTHVDAPFHFNEEGWKVGEIPLQRLIARGVLIDISNKVQGNADFVLEREDIKEWESQHGAIPDESIVLFRFGWSSRYYDNRTAYFGFGNSNSSEMNFPGLSKDAAKYIVEAGNVFGVGLDTPSLDPGKIVSFEAHQTLLGAQIFGIENLNLENDALPATGFMLHVLPMKITYGTGAPCRVIAFLDCRERRL